MTGWSDLGVSPQTKNPPQDTPSHQLQGEEHCQNQHRTGGAGRGRSTTNATPSLRSTTATPAATGILSKTNEGYGFLKNANGNRSKTGDVYVSQSQIRRFGLRPGDEVSGQVRLPKDGETVSQPRAG